MLKSVEKNEIFPLTLLFIHSFLNGLALVFFETAANTLFLMNYNTSELPYVYILTSFVSVLVGYYYTKLENNLSIQKLLSITLFFILFIMAFFFISISIFDSKALTMGIMIFKDVAWVFVGIEFGMLTGIIFNIRQGKRLFGLLMSGEILAGIIGGLSVGIIVQFIDTINLLIISIVSMVVSFLLLLKILNEFSEKFQDEQNDEDEDDEQISYKSLFKNRYYVLFFVVSVLSFFIFYFIDYIFYYKVEERFTDEKELAAFFGIFFAMLNIVNLTSSLFISGRMLSRFGVAFGLFAIPVMALIGTSPLIVFSTMGIAFVLIVIVKLLDEVLDISILTPAFRVLYQPIHPKQRNMVLAFRETIIEPAAMGFAGLLLLFLSMFEGIVLVCSLIVLGSLVWLYYANLLRREYVKSLKKMIDNREVFSEDMLLEGIDQSFLLKGIESNNEIEVLYYIDLLEKLKYKDMDKIFIKLSSHKSKMVRKSIFKKIEKSHDVIYIGILNERITKEKDPEVFDILLRAYCKLGRENVLSKVIKYIYDENKNIRQGAVVGLLKYCGKRGVDHGSEILTQLFASNDEKKILIALEIINSAGVYNFKERLSKSLKSPNENIRKTALQTAGNLKNIEFVPDILNCLEEEKYRQNVILSLEKFGDKIFDIVKEYFTKTDKLPLKATLIKIMGNLQSNDADCYLLELLKEPLLTNSVIETLFNNDFTTADNELIDKLIKNSVEDILNDLNVLNDIDKESYPNSYLIINEELNKKINNILYILGFVYPKNILKQVILNFNSNSFEAKAFAVELIDNMLRVDLKKIILPLLDDISINNKLSNYDETFNHLEYKEENYFNSVIKSDTSDILKISLIYEIGKNSNKRYLPLIKDILEDETNSKLVNETVQWTYKILNDESIEVIEEKTEEELPQKIESEIEEISIEQSNKEAKIKKDKKKKKKQNKQKKESVKKSKKRV
ncbi:MAG: MFS transporter [Campylobacterota bacterium]|nr:MFS transporter [Campylobacterota bacterium]